MKKADILFDSKYMSHLLQSRYYNPEWSRFINADTIIGQPGELLTQNLFSYCGNNPINREDADGHWWNIAAGAVIGAVINVSILAITDKATRTKSTWGDYAAAAVGGAIKGGLMAGGFRVLNPFVDALVSATVKNGVNEVVYGQKTSFKRFALEVGEGFIVGKYTKDICKKIPKGKTLKKQLGRAGKDISIKARKRLANLYRLKNVARQSAFDRSVDRGYNWAKSTVFR